MKKCRECKLEKPLTEFNKKVSNKDGLQSECRECNKVRSRQFYMDNKKSQLVAIRINTKGYIKRNQQIVIEYLRSHPCVDCKESDIIVLDFDHQGDKDQNVSTAVRNGWSIKRLMNEIAKCEIVCSNCHRRRTAKQFGYYKYAPEALADEH